MASIAKEKNGTRRILFVAPNGSRKTIRLGKVSQRAAESVKFRVEQLLAAKLTGHAVDADTARWVAGLEQTLTDKLSRVGLIDSRESQPSETLESFLTAYIKGRTDVKPLTIRHLNDARRNLVAYFGEGKLLSEIAPGDADDFRRHLLQRLGENTVRRQCGRAKQFFRAAVRKRLIRENPFGDMKSCTVQANRSRDFFVTREIAEKVLEACPDDQWRLIFALSRYAGLRCPSEHLSLRWQDVLWDQDRLVVTSPKLEHHEGKGTRVVPIFPELRPHLEAAFHAADEGTEFIITRYRDANANLRTQLLRIIRRAGLTPWPKLFHNLRATRETELAQSFPLHVVCAWIGNSSTVAAKHYLQVTDDHFNDATEAAQNPAHESGKAVQNPAQHKSAVNRRDSHESVQPLSRSAVMRLPAKRNSSLRKDLVPPQGLEPWTY